MCKVEERISKLLSILVSSIKVESRLGQLDVHKHKRKDIGLLYIGDMFCEETPSYKMNYSKLYGISQTLDVLSMPYGLSW